MIFSARSGISFGICILLPAFTTLSAHQQIFLQCFSLYISFMEKIKVLIIIAASLIFMVSCEEEAIECMRVSGETETQKRTVHSFNKIFFNDVGNLHISQGNEQQVLFKGQKSVLENLIVTVMEEELRVSLAQCFNGNDYQLDIFVTVPELTQVTMAGAGDLTTTGRIVADDITIIHSGVTNRFYFDVDADSLSTIVQGKGDVKIAGLANKHKILFSGAGQINAYELATKSTDILLSGRGDVFVNASEKLSATIKGVGNIHYRGNPEINQDISGTGKLINDN